MNLRATLVFLALMSACSSDPAPAQAQPDAPATATLQPGLQYDGSIALVHAAATGAGQALSAVVGSVEISAPIIPDVTVLYAAEGTAFPATFADERALAAAAALDFESLLVECAAYPDDAAIVRVGPNDPPLTSAQLATNYELVAECSYVHHTAKPYWIPQLVDDVDICGDSLGSDWRLLAESDLDALTIADFQALADALSGAAGSNFGAMYFSLHTYVRDGNGLLAQAHLDPLATTRVEPLTTTPTFHLEGDVGLRCIRPVTP